MFDRRARLARVLVAAALATFYLGACSSLRTFLDPANIEYRGAAQGPVLDVPPDLVTPQGSERYSLPARTSSQTLSDFNRERAAAGDAAPRTNDVLPVRDGARIERDGAVRWIVINQPAEKVWPQLRDFWASQGFALALDSAETGILETEWAERRQRVETTGVRGVLSRTLGSSYSTGERDRYRTRIERAANGTTEIYVTHRGMEEVVTGILKDESIWQPRPSNPELEIEYLRRLLAQFGVPRQAVTVARADNGPAGAGAAASARTRVVSEGDLSSLQIREGFDRAWRDVGLVLDRVGFTVEDRDRSKGIYFVRYVDLDRRDPRQGTISRFFSGERKDLMGQRYQISIASGTSEVTLTVRDAAGELPASPENKRVANRIVTLLNEEMK
ncbi:MAG: outer membrane protein assembly factor BamC [Lautropia sp.]|nr:outer membrane protein assembly factor BamC [Lautropia sp.]